MFARLSILRASCLAMTHACIPLKRNNFIGGPTLSFDRYTLLLVKLSCPAPRALVGDSSRGSLGAA